MCEETIKLLIDAYNRAVDKRDYAQADAIRVDLMLVIRGED